MAVRNFHWRGNGAGTKSDFNDGRNFVDDAEAPYAQAVYPGTAADDYAFFDKQLVAGALGCTTQLDRTADTNLKALRVSEDYMLSTGIGTGAIGGAGTPLIIDVDVEVVIEAQCNDIYLKGAGTALVNVQILKTYTGKKVYLDGTINGLIGLKGTAHIESTATVQNKMMIGYIDSPRNDFALTVEAGATLPSVVVANGGNVDCDAALTTLYLTDAIWDGSGNVTTLYQSNGLYKWTDGDITDAYISGNGKIDGTVSELARTLTRGHVSGGGIIDIETATRAITVSSWIAMLGGSVKWPKGLRVVPTV